MHTCLGELLASHEFGKYMIETEQEEMKDMWAKLEEGLDINQVTGQGLGIDLGLTSVWNRDLAIDLGTKYERGLEGAHYMVTGLIQGMKRGMRSTSKMTSSFKRDFC